jgi:hypothetical protein
MIVEEGVYPAAEGHLEFWRESPRLQRTVFEPTYFASAWIIHANLACHRPAGRAPPQVDIGEPSFRLSILPP